MADQASYTVILTKGVHLVDRAAADAIRAAIENGDRTVEVTLDPLGNADVNRRTLVAVRHIIALAENGRDVAGPMPANVAPLQRSAGSAARGSRLPIGVAGDF